MASGVYKITNTANGKIYIGSSRRMARRKHDHRKTLRCGTHHNGYLQASWNKYGPDAFVFSTVVLCAPEELRATEQKIIDELRPEYNLMRPGTTGWNHSAETIERQREVAKRLWEDPAFLEKMRPHTEKKAALKAANKAARAARATPERVITYDGVSLTYAGWAERLGIAKNTLIKRIQDRPNNLGVALKLVAPEMREPTVYVVRGETRTLSEWALHLGVPINTLYMRMYRSNLTPEEALVSTYSVDHRKTKEQVDARSKKIEFRGESLTYAEWAERLGVSKSCIVSRLETNGWDIERALTTPEIKGKPPTLYTFRGEQASAAQIAQALQLDPSTVRDRIKDGESPDDIKPGRKRRMYAFQGVERTTDGWAEVLGVSAQHVGSRIKKLGVDEALRLLHENVGRNRMDKKPACQDTPWKATKENARRTWRDLQ